MALTLSWKPNVGPVLVLNSTYYPINEELSIDVDFDDPSAGRMQLPGEYETFGYAGAARITADGQIFGDTKADFWTKRNAFLVAFTHPNRELTNRHHGILTIADTDAPEPMFQKCRIVSRTAKLETLSPQRCPFLVVFKAFSPYFTGASTGKDYLLG